MPKSRDRGTHLSLELDKLTHNRIDTLKTKLGGVSAAQVVRTAVRVLSRVGHGEVRIVKTDSRGREHVIELFIGDEDGD